jgi:hypothetical protein
MCGFVGMFVGVVEGLDLQEFFAQGGEGDGEWAARWWAAGDGRGEERVVVCYVWESGRSGGGRRCICRLRSGGG